MTIESTENDELFVELLRKAATDFTTHTEYDGEILRFCKYCSAHLDSKERGHREDCLHLRAKNRLKELDLNESSDDSTSTESCPECEKIFDHGSKHENLNSLKAHLSDKHGLDVPYRKMHETCPSHSWSEEVAV